MSVTSRIIRYPVDEYPFAWPVRRAFDWSNLEELHRWDHAAQYPRFDRSADQKTVYHRQWYKFVREEPGFLEIYRTFLRDVVSKDDVLAEKGDFLYQKIPTFRVHLPGNVCVGEFHRDRDYGHPRESWNYLVPLTRAFRSSTVWVEFFDSFTHYDLSPGDVLRFDGANLLHGNVPNLCDFTRVSFDFRVLPVSKIDPAHAGATINTGQRFVEGDFYERFRV